MTADDSRSTLQSPELERKILSWLTSQGYPLEMRLAQALQRVSHVTQSDFYFDPDHGVRREIDVVARSRPWHSEDGQTWFDFNLCIEAKGSPEKPWILFCGDRDPLHPVASVYQRHRSPATRHWWRTLAHDAAIQQLPLFAIEENPGYGMVRATFSSSQREDVAYAAVLGAAKASAALVTRTDVAPPLSKIHVLAQPIVFVDAPLFKCSLDDAGHPQLSRVNRGTLVWRNSVGGFIGHTIVLVVSEAGLTSLVDDFQETTTKLGDWLTQNAASVQAMTTEIADQ
ncbi:hypothetical protein ACWCHM_13725 [Micromonospora sp. SCSIO 07396]